MVLDYLLFSQTAKFMAGTRFSSIFPNSEYSTYYKILYMFLKNSYKECTYIVDNYGKVTGISTGENFAFSYTSTAQKLYRQVS